MKTRVIIVDDHALIRRGLRESLVEAGDIEVVGEAIDYGSLRRVLRETECDVLILDINLPGRNGIEIVKLLTQEQSGIKIIMLSQYPEDQYGIRALKAGAMAYLNKNGPLDSITKAVRTVAGQRKFVTPELALALADSVNTSDASAHEKLSDREMQTLLLIAQGHKLSKIADQLMLSPKTVSVYRSRIMAKLGVNSNAELGTYAARAGLIA